MEDPFDSINKSQNIPSSKTAVCHEKFPKFGELTRKSATRFSKSEKKTDSRMSFFKRHPYNFGFMNEAKLDFPNLTIIT